MIQKGPLTCARSHYNKKCGHNERVIIHREMKYIGGRVIVYSRYYQLESCMDLPFGLSEPLIEYSPNSMLGFSSCCVPSIAV